LGLLGVPFCICTYYVTLPPQKCAGDTNVRRQALYLNVSEFFVSSVRCRRPCRPPPLGASSAAEAPYDLVRRHHVTTPRGRTRCCIQLGRRTDRSRSRPNTTSSQSSSATRDGHQRFLGSCGQFRLPPRHPPAPPRLPPLLLPRHPPPTPTTRNLRVLPSEVPPVERWDSHPPPRRSNPPGG
jgi:hypothetical protein